jgi:DNA (cytosine-5)-methyltransferase 1
VRKLTVGDLFSGIGGFSLGLERTGGFETKWFVENDPFCQKVLAKHWPNVKRHGDIKNVGKHNLEPVDLICGGFPCQPFSVAGKRKGTEDNRYLWGEMFRVISDVKPTWVIAENVRGLLSIEGGMVFENCCLDLESIGYEVQAFIIPACAVNAPHRRDRVWIVAYSVSRSSEISNSGTVDCENGETQKCRKTDIQDSSAYRNCHAPDTARELSHGSREPRGRRGEFADKSCSLADTSNQGLSGSEWPGPHEQGQATHGSTSERNYAWDEPWLEAAQRFCKLDDGLPDRLVRPARNRNRVQKLKALGNAVVPQIVEILGRAILKVDSCLKHY